MFRFFRRRDNDKETKEENVKPLPDPLNHLPVPANREALETMFEVHEINLHNFNKFFYTHNDDKNANHPWKLHEKVIAWRDTTTDKAWWNTTTVDDQGCVFSDYGATGVTHVVTVRLGMYGSEKLRWIRLFELLAHGRSQVELG